MPTMLTRFVLAIGLLWPLGAAVHLSTEASAAALLPPKSQLQRRSSPIANVPQDGTAKPTVACPAGFVATSGGFHVPVVTNSAPHPAHVYDSFPNFGTDPMSWNTSALNPKALSGPATVQGFVTCLNKASGSPLRVLYPEKAASVPGGTLTTIFAPCRAGYKAVGGGFDVNGTANFNRPFSILASFPGKVGTVEGWAVRIANPEDSSTVQAIAHAVCMLPGKDKIQAVASAKEPVPRNSIRVTDVNCPGVMNVLGGGFMIEGAPELGAFPPIVTSSYGNFKGADWTAIVANPRIFPVLTKAATLTVYAVCVTFAR